MVADDLERREHRYRQERTGYPPELPPECDADEYCDGVQRKPMSHHHRSNEISLNQIQRDKTSGYQQRVSHTIEHRERRDCQYHNERDRADVRYELEACDERAPEERVRHLEQVHDQRE